MIEIRKHEDRGHFNHGWLDTYHTFSFGDYHDPQHVHFGNLRVINEDRVEPGEGFDTHGHHDMEIVTYIIEGELEHKDSMGNGSIIRAGDVQRMSAGTGVTHSEFNPSKQVAVWLLQIWIFPREKGLKSEYEQKHFSREKKRNNFHLIVSPDGESESLRVNQDVKIYSALFSSATKKKFDVKGHKTWLQVISGSLKLNSQSLSPGDGAAISDETEIQLEALKETEFLLFKL